MVLGCTGNKTGVSTWLRGVQRGNLYPVVGEASVRTLSKTEVCVTRRWVEDGSLGRGRRLSKARSSMEHQGTPVGIDGACGGDDEGLGDKELCIVPVD